VTVGSERSDLVVNPGQKCMFIYISLFFILVQKTDGLFATDLVLVSVKWLWERGDVYTGLWWEKLRKRDHLEDLAVDGRLIVKLIFKNESREPRVD
jgi:hypothetical protein